MEIPFEYHKVVRQCRQKDYLHKAHLTPCSPDVAREIILLVTSQAQNESLRKMTIVFGKRTKPFIQQRGDHLEMRLPRTPLSEDEPRPDSPRLTVGFVLHELAHSLGYYDHEAEFCSVFDSVLEWFWEGTDTEDIRSKLTSYTSARVWTGAYPAGYEEDFSSGTIGQVVMGKKLTTCQVCQKPAVRYNGRDQTIFIHKGRVNEKGEVESLDECKVRKNARTK